VDTAVVATGHALGAAIAVEVAEVGRDGDMPAKPPFQERGGDITAIGSMDVGKEPVVAVRAFGGDFEADGAIIAQQIDQCLAGAAGKRFIGGAVAAEFGGVDAHEANAAAIGESHRIAIEHGFNRCPRVDACRRACRGDGGGGPRKQKGARKERPDPVAYGARPQRVSQRW